MLRYRRGTDHAGAASPRHGLGCSVAHPQPTSRGFTRRSGGTRERDAERHSAGCTSRLARCAAEWRADTRQCRRRQPSDDQDGASQQVLPMTSVGRRACPAPCRPARRLVNREKRGKSLAINTERTRSEGAESRLLLAGSTAEEYPAVRSSVDGVSSRRVWARRRTRRRSSSCADGMPIRRRCGRDWACGTGVENGGFVRHFRLLDEVESTEMRGRQEGDVAVQTVRRSRPSGAVHQTQKPRNSGLRASPHITWSP